MPGRWDHDLPWSSRFTHGATPAPHDVRAFQSAGARLCRAVVGPRGRPSPWATAFTTLSPARLFPAEPQWPGGRSGLGFPWAPAGQGLWAQGRLSPAWSCPSARVRGLAGRGSPRVCLLAPLGSVEATCCPRHPRGPERCSVAGCGPGTGVGGWHSSWFVRGLRDGKTGQCR